MRLVNPVLYPGSVVSGIVALLFVYLSFIALHLLVRDSTRDIVDVKGMPTLELHANRIETLLFAYASLQWASFVMAVYLFLLSLLGFLVYLFDEDAGKE